MAIYVFLSILISSTAAYVASTLVATLIARLGFPLPSKRRRIGCIDGLRGYLAISVLIHHFIIWLQIQRFGLSWEAPSINFFNQLGVGGVALFFMTSGFVFYPRVLAGFRACSWPALYTTRVFRIVPLVIGSLALITAIIMLRTGHGFDRTFPVAAIKWIATWSEPPLLEYPDSGRLNAYVLWSLWFEWLFYLFVLPGCALAMDVFRNRAPSWAVPVCLLAAAITANLFHLPGSFFNYLPLFAIGMLAYECQQRERIAQRLRRPHVTLVAAIALGVGMTTAANPYGFAMPLFGLFFTCIACGNDMGGLLRTRGAMVLGECSYGIYLLHGILLNLLFVDAAAVSGRIATAELPFLLPIASMAITVVTSITYLLIERPMIRAGSGLATRWTGRRLRPDAPAIEVAP